MKKKKSEEIIVLDQYVEIASKKQEQDFSDAIASLNEEERHEVSKALHKKDLEAFDKKENALCFIVIGSILAVIGCLFIFLSFKKKMNKIVGIDTMSLQFWVMIIAFVIAVGCLTYGFIRFFKALKARKTCRNRINQLTKE